MKKLMILLLVLVMVLSSFTTVFAKPVNLFEDQLSELLERGILRGDDDGNLNLDDGLTRAEGVTVYSRLFGLEEDLEYFSKENKNYKTEFIDVPRWAEDTINYLYYTDVTKGISVTEFGSNNPMSDVQFMTMILRGLGFKDSEGEFVWNKSLEKAVELNMLDDETKEAIEKEELFTREEMAKISYYAMYFIEAATDKEIDETGNNYIELTDKEVAELSSGKKTLFTSDRVHQQEMYDKLYDYLHTEIDKYEIVLNGSPVDIEVSDITGVGYPYDDLGVTFNSGTFLKLKFDKNRLTYEREYSLRMLIFEEAAFPIYFSDESYLKGSGKLNQGHFPLDPNEFVIDVSAGGRVMYKVRTVDFNPETLVWKITVK